MRIAFLGFSQTLPSYARRLCRRLVDHHFRLLEGPETLPSSLTSGAIDSATRGMTQRTPQQLRRRQIVSNLRRSTAYEAAFEGIAFLRSCTGAVSFAEGDLLPGQVEGLLVELKDIFRPAIGSGGGLSSGGGALVATPTIDDLVYRPVWKPRSAFSCSVPGVALISDACGRIPR